MGSLSSSDVREYYRRLTEVDIAEVARELLGERIVQEHPDRLECDCPNHESLSHRSLHVFPAKQGWYCFGCSVGGDVLQLVEFVQSGSVTRGTHGQMPDSHRRARDFLADKAGLPPLGREGSTKEQLAELEAARVLELRTQEALTELARFYHRRLRDNPKALDWLQSNYGLNDETIDSLLLGYADNTQGPDAHGNPCRGPIGALTRGSHKFEQRDLAATGAFVPTSQDGLIPFFDRRIVFPYWSRGRVVFMIGRKTPWTQASKWEQGKYKKLLVHEPKKRRHVAPCVHNGYIYNEDVLLERPERVVITEGVTDCIAAMQAGIPCISPVTTRFRRRDVDRLVRLTERAGQVVICNDSEESGAGEEGALKTAAALFAARRDVRIAAIPRPEGKEKIDVNELVVTQGAGALRDVLARAKRYPEYLVDKIPRDTPGADLDRHLAPVLELVAQAEPLAAQTVLDTIVARLDVKRRPLSKLLKEVTRRRRARRDAQETASPDSLPQVRVNGRQLREIVLETAGLLVDASHRRLEGAAAGVVRQDGMPVVFVRSGSLVQLLQREGQVSISDMNKDATHAVITRLADWVRETEEGVFPVFPPRDVACDLHTLVPTGIPEIESVITTPVFGKDGSLIERPGYHECDLLWLQPGGELDLPPVPKVPTQDEVESARRLITDELLVDFPFTDQADRAGAIAGLLLPFVRRMIPGPTPIHLVEAPTPGTGKSLLCSLISIVATGVPAEARTLPEQEEEVRKSLTAELARARPLILIDNASERRKIDSSALAAIATSEVWTDRLLGSTRMLSLANRALWLLTANNPRLSNELTRRCIRIRVDPKLDRPWQRQGFKHDPVAEWALENRPQLVHSALVLVQAWVAAGTPDGSQRLGSFERWSAVLGGVLDVAGIDGFLGNLDEFYAAADTEGEMWRDFTAAWWQAFGNQEMRIAELNDFCEQQGLMNSVRGDKGLRSQQIRLGHALRSARDRVYGGLRVELVRDKGQHKGKRYSLSLVGEDSWGSGICMQAELALDELDPLWLESEEVEY